MAYNPAPSNWIPGVKLVNAGGTVTNGSGESFTKYVCIPLESFSGLDASEADPTSGDFRKVYRAMFQALYEKWMATAEADRPLQMDVSRSSYENQSTGTMHRTFVNDFNVDFVGEEVAPEQ